MRAHRPSVRIRAYLLVLCLVAAPHRRIYAGKGAPAGEKTNPVAIMAILIEPAFNVASSCEPGRPVVFLKVRVANKGPANAPALTEGIEAYDGSTPAWHGTAALPALRAGEVVERTIAMNAPANPGTLAGRHVFHVRIVLNAKNHVEQSSSAGPVVVDIPTGLCRSTSLSGAEKVEGPTPTPTPRPVNVPARPPRQQQPINEPPKHN